MFLMSALAKWAPLLLMVLFQKGVQRDHVSGVGGEFERVVDKVTSNSDADTIRVLLLWAMVDYNLSIRYHSVVEDMPNFIVGEEEDGVGSFGDTRFALGKAMNFLGKASTQRSLRWGSCCSFLCCMIICLVIGWTTPKQCSSMLMMGPVHCDWVATLKALRVMT
jgi:hypothetical protein